MRRGAAALGYVLLWSAACGGDPVPQASPAITVATTSASSPPVRVDGLPPLLVFARERVWRYEDGARHDLFELDEGTVALALPGPQDEIVVQQQLQTSSRILHVIDGAPDVVAENADLYEAAVVSGSPSVVYGRCDEVEGSKEGDVFVRDLSGGRERSLGMNCGPEYGVASVSFGGDTFVISAGCDLSECIRFVSADGEPLDRESPTDDLAYNDPPYVRDATLSPDGKLLAYLAGPDSPGVSPEKKVGDWVLVVVAQPSGKERLRYGFAGKDRYVNRLDFDGRWAIVSVAPGEAELGQWSGIAGGEPGPVAAIDTMADDPTLVDLGFDGVATIATER